jgi:hypothetical protein
MVAPSTVNVTPSLDWLSAGRGLVGTAAAVLVIMFVPPEHAVLPCR